MTYMIDEKGRRDDYVQYSTRAHGPTPVGVSATNVQSARAWAIPELLWILSGTRSNGTLSINKKMSKT